LETAIPAGTHFDVLQPVLMETDLHRSHHIWRPFQIRSSQLPPIVKDPVKDIYAGACNIPFGLANAIRLRFLGVAVVMNCATVVLMDSLQWRRER